MKDVISSTGVNRYFFPPFHGKVFVPSSRKSSLVKYDRERERERERERARARASESESKRASERAREQDSERAR